jgi:hypothetical protein
MIELFNIIYLLGLAVLWTYSEYGILFRRYIGFKEEEYDNYSPNKRFIHRGLYCGYCSSFWIALLVSFNFKTAVIVSLFAFILEKF